MVTPWIECPGCTYVLPIEGSGSILQPALPQCDICGWQHWGETKQPQWHDIDYGQYSFKRPDWKKMMFGMKGARIAFPVDIAKPWTLGCISTVQEIKDVHSNTRLPMWLIQTGRSASTCSLGVSPWRLLGTQRVYLNPTESQDADKSAMLRFYSLRDSRCNQLLLAYRHVLDRLITVSNVVGLVLEYLVWHDKDRYVANKLFA